jgi:hypothetical protein
MNLFEKFHEGLSYADFLSRYATDAQKERWQAVHSQVVLTPAQVQLLGSFRRAMNVMCLVGAWCGDCSGQCPIFEHFAAGFPGLTVRYLDRDTHADVQRELQINGGDRVPVIVLFSEDGFEASRIGERTLSRYRQAMREQAGPACPTGITAPGDSLLAQVTQEWLNEFERVQWMLCLSPRLRERHGDD